MWPASGLRSGSWPFAALVACVAVALWMASLSSPARAASAAACPARAAASRQVELRAGGLERQLYVVDPGGLGRRPVVIALHGWGGNGEQMAAYSGLAARAQRGGFIAAFPSSHGLGWNIAAARRAPDDLAFLRAIIAYLTASDCGDPARVFLTGVSNGGGMAALAGCRLAGRVRAIAPVAGDYDPLPSCRPARPVAVLEIHGTRDQEAGYFGRSRRRAADGLPPFVNRWVALDGCAGAPLRRRLAPRALLYRWRRCRAGGEVEHIQIAGGRHQWPGANPPDPGPPATFSAARAVLAFFASLPLSA